MVTASEPPCRRTRTPRRPMTLWRSLRRAVIRNDGHQHRPSIKVWTGDRGLKVGGCLHFPPHPPGDIGTLDSVDSQPRQRNVRHSANVSGNPSTGAFPDRTNISGPAPRQDNIRQPGERVSRPRRLLRSSRKLGRFEHEHGRIRGRAGASADLEIRGVHEGLMGPHPRFERGPLTPPEGFVHEFLGEVGGGLGVVGGTAVAGPFRRRANSATATAAASTTMTIPATTR